MQNFFSFQVFDPAKPAMRSYNLLFDGKRIVKGYLAYRVQSPMTPGKKKALVECKLSVSLVDPSVPLKFLDASGKPLSDDALRASDTRARTPIVNEMLVSGDGSMKDPIPLPIEVLRQLRSGVIDLEFKMAASSNAACKSKDTPLIVSKSFVTLQVAQVDGVIQTIGLEAGYANVQPTTPLSGASLSVCLFVGDMS